jgi:hypothetical protein
MMRERVGAAVAFARSRQPDQSAYPQEVAAFLPKSLPPKTPRSPPAGRRLGASRDMIDDPEVVARDFKFDADFWMFGCHLREPARQAGVELAQ